MSNIDIEYIKNENEIKSLKDFPESDLYEIVKDENERKECDDYALLYNYPFYFKWDKGEYPPTYNGIEGSEYRNQCIFRKDSRLDKFDFSGTEYRDIIMDRSKYHITQYTPTNPNMTEYAVYEISYNTDFIINNKFKIDDIVEDTEISRLYEKLNTSYTNFLNRKTDRTYINTFADAYNDIKKLKQTVDTKYNLNELIEFRKLFTLLVKEMDKKIYEQQKQLDKILLIDGANNGKLQDIKFMNFFIISKSLILILVLLISSRYIIKYKNK